MKLPDLSDLEAAGVHHGAVSAEALAGASAAARLRYFSVDLGPVESKMALLDALAGSLAFPAHFGRNWDALADCLEDATLVGKHGAVVRIMHAGAYRSAHAQDWKTLEEILDEAAGFWKERHLPFWVFVN
ncbi:MAG: barstar family protein [Casimicrobiaceae bacterium]